MAAVTFTIESDEVLGIQALTALDALEMPDLAAGGSDADRRTDEHIAAVARELIDAALAEKLASAGLPWAPSAEAVSERAVRPGAGPAPGKPRAGLPYVLAAGAVAAAVVVLVGGYAGGWAWTGFRSNGQLWDWLTLVLLPLAAGLIPVWLQYKTQIGTRRRAAYAAVFAASAVFVLAGYLVPLGWTGFRGQTLWNWLELLVLPLAIAGTTALIQARVRLVTVLRSLGDWQKGVAAALAAAWIVTLVGGYAWGWRWTGYAGNSLWDWLQLLLLPVIFPTVLLPFLLKWITGDAEARAARQAAETARAGRTAARRESAQAPG